MGWLESYSPLAWLEDPPSGNLFTPHLSNSSPVALSLRNLKYLPHLTGSFWANYSGFYRFPLRSLKLWSPNLQLHLPHSHPSPLGALWMPAQNTCWRQRKFTCNRYSAGVKPTLGLPGSCSSPPSAPSTCRLASAKTGNYCQFWVQGWTIWNHFTRPDDCYLARCSGTLFCSAASDSWRLWDERETQDWSTGSF